MEVTIRRPLGFARWRWFFCWHLIKLAAKFYPFTFQFYRKSEWEDKVRVPPS